MLQETAENHFGPRATQPKPMCLQTRHLLCLQTRHLLCQQTRHLLCHCVSRHLPRHPLQHSPHRGGRFAAAPVWGMLGGMSWEMSADTMTQQMSCLLTQQMSCLQAQQMSCLQTQECRNNGYGSEGAFSPAAPRQLPGSSRGTKCWRSVELGQHRENPSV